MLNLDSCPLEAVSCCWCRQDAKESRFVKYNYCILIFFTAAQRYPHALAEIADICGKGAELGEDSLFGISAFFSSHSLESIHSNEIFTLICSGASLVAASDSFNQITEANHGFVSCIFIPWSVIKCPLVFFRWEIPLAYLLRRTPKCSRISWSPWRHFLKRISRKSL